MAKKKVAKKKVAKKAKTPAKKKSASKAAKAEAARMFAMASIIQSMRESQESREADAKAALRELAPKLFVNCVAKVHVEYNGEGDSGDIEYVAYIDINDDDIPHALSHDDEERLKNAIWPFVPSGFENNEGGFGHIYIDLKNNSVLCEHSERIIETNDSAKEFTF
jgi:hypothetical protein